MSFLMMFKTDINKCVATIYRHEGCVSHRMSHSNNIHIFIPRAKYEELQAFYDPSDTEFSKTFGVIASPVRSCNKRFRFMDKKECDWCEHNANNIVSWLAEEAKKRKMPYGLFSWKNIESSSDK